MIYKTERYDIVVCGGGMAGFCAAVTAAREGQRVCLVHNRPVFGGNASSEVGVTIHGAAAFHAYARETGIISELLIEERKVNHEEIYENGWINSTWDLVMYNMAVTTPGLTFYLNTEVYDVECKERIITGVKARVLNAETELKLKANVFVDCTGDALVAHLAGCETKWGSEARSEYDEPHAPEYASKNTMGSSIHFRTKNMGHQVPYKAPGWAVNHDDPSYFYDQGRIPKNKKGGYWWLEIGVPFDTIHDNETIRHELTKHTLGVWDWMKNKDPKLKDKLTNYALDWIGQVPGKRENRRVVGEYFMTEKDIQEKRVFEDEIAFGGWFVDLHTPGGLLAEHAEASSATDGEEYDTFNEYSVLSYCGPYGIPLRSLIARDMDNLLMAGRNISCSHAALGTLRVMGTTSLMGQACGVTATVANRECLSIREVQKHHINEVQQILLKGGCFLPNVTIDDSKDSARLADISVSSSERLYESTPEKYGVHTGLAHWWDQPQYTEERMFVRKGQLISIGKEGVEQISLCLTNTSSVEQEVQVIVSVCDHIWDYRVELSAPLAQAKLSVPVGEKQWVNWKVNLPSSLSEDTTYIRIDLLPNPEIIWHEAGRIIPGNLAMYQIGKDKMRRFGHGSTLSFRVHPAQNCFGGESVISGVTRPYKQPNLWISDPKQSLPQWLSLNWEKEQTIGRIQLTFPGHLLREYHAYGSQYSDPQCPSNYSVELLKNGEWCTLVEIEGNYQRQRIHILQKSVSTNEVRVVIKTTNGDPSAAIYEIRTYSE